jgi:hypothetical protein
MSKRCGLFLGRFQPPTVAHLETVRTILKQWDNLTIAVVFNSLRPSEINPAWIDLLKTEDSDSYLQLKNPFYPAEVFRMWKECLKVEKLLLRVTVTKTRRPQFYPFNKRFSPQEYDWISVAPPKDNPGPQHRLQTYEELFGRKIWQARPSFQLHNTEIKKLVSISYSWREFIPAGAFKVFMEIGGLHRLITTTD